MTSLKGVLGNLSDEDIEINVEKGVVYVSISDKLLFRSGSYTVTSRAKEVLGKVAKVVNEKPDIEFMVEVQQKRGLQLFAILASVFCPSKEVFPYIMSHLEKVKTTTEIKVQNMNNIFWNYSIE